MNKNILIKYSDAKARIKYLRQSIKKIEAKIEKLEYTDYGIVGDTVSKGKRGKKPLGTVKITGFSVPEHREATSALRVRKALLKNQEEKLLQLTNDVEEFIAGIKNIEMQNILTLYYIEDLSWQQVANNMCELRTNKTYTADSCRVKHERFLKKI